MRIQSEKVVNKAKEDKETLNEEKKSPSSGNGSARKLVNNPEQNATPSNSSAKKPTKKSDAQKRATADSETDSDHEMEQSSSESSSDSDSDNDIEPKKKTKRKEKDSKETRSAKRNGRKAARRGGDKPLPTDKRFNGKSTEFINTYLAAFDSVRSKNKVDPDTAAGAKNGAQLARTGAPRPEPNHQRLFLSKSPNYVTAYLVAFDKTANKMKEEENSQEKIDAHRGKENGIKAARSGKERPERTDKVFKEKSETYIDAYLKSFDEESSKLDKDTAHGKTNGAEHARKGGSRPELSSKIFEDKSKKYINAYWKAYDETLEKIGTDLDEVAGRINGTKAAETQTICPSPEDKRFEGRSKKYRDAYIKAFKAVHDTTETTPDITSAIRNGRLRAIEGYPCPKENDDLFKGKSKEYIQAYLKAYDDSSFKTSAESDTALGKRQGRKAAQAGYRKPEDDDKRLKNKSDEFKVAYKEAFDDASPRDEEQLSLTAARKNGAYAAKMGHARPADDDERFEGKSKEYKKAFLEAYDKTEKPNKSMSDIIQAKEKGRLAATKGLSRPKLDDERFKGMSSEYKETYLKSFDDTRAKSDKDPDVVHGTLQGKNAAKAGSKRPSEKDKRFKGRSEKYIKAYLTSFDATPKGEKVKPSETKTARKSGAKAAARGMKRPAKTDARFKDKNPAYIEAYLEGFDNAQPKSSADKDAERGKVNGRNARSRGQKRPADDDARFKGESPEYKKAYLSVFDQKGEPGSKPSIAKSKAKVANDKKDKEEKKSEATSIPRKIPKKASSHKSSTSHTSSATAKNTKPVKPSSSSIKNTSDMSTHDAKTDDSRKRKRDEVLVEQPKDKADKADKKSVDDITKRPQKQAKISDKTSTAEAGLTLAVNVGSDSAASVAVANSVPVIVSESAATNTDTAPISVATSSSALPTAPADSRKRKHEQMAETEKLIEMDESDESLPNTSDIEEPASKKVRNDGSASVGALIGMWQRSSIAGTRVGNGSPSRPSENEERSEKKMKT